MENAVISGGEVSAGIHELMEKLDGAAQTAGERCGIHRGT